MRIVLCELYEFRIFILFHFIPLIVTKIKLNCFRFFINFLLLFYYFIIEKNYYSKEKSSILINS